MLTVSACVMLWAAAAGADPLLSSEPGSLEQAGVATAPRGHLLDEAQEQHLARAGAGGPVDLEDGAPLLAPEDVLAAATLLGEPENAFRSSENAVAGQLVAPLEQEPRVEVAAVPMPVPPGNRWAATGRTPLVLPVVPADVAPMARILLSVAAGAGASLAVAGGALVLTGQYLLALVSTHAVRGQRRAATLQGGSLLLVGGTWMVVAALGCGALAAIALGAGLAAEKLAVAVREKD
jgi:hypothetical protein